jgi:hypothetical protein
MLTFPRFSSALALAALGLSTLAGCGASYQPGRTAGFDLDASPQIDDDDIRKAFEARPQLPGTVRLAYYTFDPKVAGDLDALLAGVPGVSGVYRIPPLLVTGQRRFEAEAPREVTLKKLRLLAARAHADALLVIDHGYRARGANGFAALNVLLVPMLFTPFLDHRVEGYADAYLVDVRNGYLYGHVSEDDRRGPAYATIYAKSVEDLAAEQWQALRAGLSRDLGALLTAEQGRGRAPAGEAKTAGK